MDWHLFVEVVAVVVTVAVACVSAVFWLAWRFGQQDAQLEWQSRAIEMLMRRGGSDPPPRKRLTTLSGSEEDRKMWSDLVKKAEQLNKEKDS